MAEYLEEAKEHFSNANNLLKEGKIKEALAEYDNALNVQMDKFGKEDETLPPFYIQRGMCKMVLEDKTSALEDYKAALAIALKTKDYNSQEVANCYYLVGNAYMDMQNFEEAAVALGHVVIITSKLFGENSEQIAPVRAQYNKAMFLNNGDKNNNELVASMIDAEECYKKGSTYFDQGVTYLAVKYLEKAAEIKRNSAEPCDKRMVDYLRAVSIGYTEMDMADEALQTLSELLEISDKLFGKDTSEVSGVYNMIGYNYLLKGQYDNAIDNLQRMLDINIKLHGERDTEVIRDYSIVASVFRMKGDFDKALDYFEKVEKILLSFNTESINHDLANCYANIAAIQGDIGDKDMQITYLLKQADIEEKLHGMANPTLINIYRDLGYLYDSKGEHAEADKMLGKIQEAYTALAKMQSEHGDECGCGCGHDHHHHDDECGCGHDHHDHCECDDDDCDCDDDDCDCHHHH